MNRSAALALASVVFCLATAPEAHATVLGSSVPIDLLSPGNSLALSDTVVVGAGPEILPADGSNIGSVLLSTYFIDLDTDQIVVRLEEGAPGGLTGFAAGAQLVFSDLYAGTGLGISGVSVMLDNVTNLALGDGIGFNARTVFLAIDDLVIGEIPGIDFGTVTLDFTTAVPAPPALPLLLSALLGSWGIRRATRR